MDVVLYTDASPPRSVNAWLYRNDCSPDKGGLRGPRKPGRLVDFKPQPVAQAVTECLAVPPCADFAWRDDASTASVFGREAAHALGFGPPA